MLNIKWRKELQSLKPFVSLAETGRAGRDGEQSTAIFLCGRKVGQHVSTDVVAYGINESWCRWQKLFKNFLFLQ